MQRTLSYRIALIALLTLACATATAQQDQASVVDSDTVWIGEVVRGDLTRHVRGPGVLERFGRGFHAHVRIASTQAMDVRLDQTASVDTRAAGVLDGTVVHIEDRVEQGTIMVVVELTGEPPADLRPGLSVDTRIAVEQLEDVLHVDRPAFAMPGQTVGVFKLTGDDMAERVPVTWGKSSVSKIIVADGLEVGDRIILSDMSRYDDADRVRLTD